MLYTVYSNDKPEWSVMTGDFNLVIKTDMKVLTPQFSSVICWDTTINADLKIFFKKLIYDFL